MQISVLPDGLRQPCQSVHDPQVENHCSRTLLLTFCIVYHPEVTKIPKL